MGNGGSYPARPRVEFLSDGRIVRLLEEFAYIDPNRMRWVAPQGAQADGASIPRALWTFMGGPFEGKYRDASIIHDFYCSKRHRPWKQVHRMFFDGMITSGVGKGRASVMYAGVYAGGPRWTDMDIHNALIIERPLGIVQLPAGSIGVSFDFVKAEGNVKVSELVGGVRTKHVPEVLTIDITPVKRLTRKPPIRVAHQLTEEDVAILEQTLKTRGANFESIEQQMDDFIKERKRQSRSLSRPQAVRGNI